MDLERLCTQLQAALDGAGPPLLLSAPSARSESGAGRAQVPDGTAVVVTTSGSTGVPKSVILSRDALTASARATAQRIGSGGWLLALDPATIAGTQVLVRALMAGQTPAAVEGRFGVSSFVAAAERMPGSATAARFTSLVPAQLETLLDAATDSDDLVRVLRSFTAILVGGQALAPRTAERAANAGVTVVRTYGSTETSGGCVYDGVPLDGVDVRVRDGELQIAGPILATGYLGEPARTAASFVHDDGSRWYRTGDTGTFDGTVRVTGRRDNVIISGGVNVSLDLVEQTVRSIPGLGGAVVVAVPDPRWGQASLIVIGESGAESEPDAGPAASAARMLELEDAARSLVGEKLGAPARPRGLVAVSQIPLLSSGKPDRAALRARLAGARS